MKKILIIAFVLMIVVLAACQKQAAEVKKQDTSGDSAASQASDKAVDSIGTDINNVDSIDAELSTDELNDMDAGLSDVENI
ncbi:MAG TPA: hypothetical protein VI564_07260 [Candidatus Nanoarchaeia archaeon]|nr:hypothetical protein [Candidatus Nanoarchaeia archaeon]